MLEINVSRLVRNNDAYSYSRSAAEYGNNAGTTAWTNAKREVTERPLLRRRQCQDVRDYFGGFGAWDDAERASWDRAECGAMVLQYAAGDLRELQALCPGNGIGGINWKRAEREAQNGRVSGNLFVNGNKLYIQLSN